MQLLLCVGVAVLVLGLSISGQSKPRFITNDRRSRVDVVCDTKDNRCWAVYIRSGPFVEIPIVLDQVQRDETP